jgi:hypothetical protein
MKNLYKTTRIFLLFLTLAAMKVAAAPLSGVYTINSGVATGGTNYQTFTAFANDINTNGISGPVTVNVVLGSGPYNEQVTFNQIVGASSNNRVVINGNNCLIFFNASSGAPHTIGLNGADFFTFNNLQINGTSPNYAYPAILYSGADYNTFTGCTFSVNANITTSGAIPFVISGSGQNYYTYGTTGNYNTVQSCTIFSGYMGVSIYSNYSPPYQKGNTFSGCKVTDFYVYGFNIQAYTDMTTIKNNTISCPARTNNTTKYGIYCYGTQNTLIEGNWIRDLFSTSLSGNTSQAFGMDIWYNTESSYTGQFYPSRNRNIIRNNIISDINHNGTLYGIRAYYYDGEMYNNTISLDYAGATGGTTYGIFQYAYQSNYVSHVNNNIVTITRGGGGAKYAFYNASGTSGSDLTLERNDFYVTPGSSNYVGYYTAFANTLAQLQTQGVMLTGFSALPTYTAAYDYHPTNTAINNAAIQMGLVFDQSGAVRNPTTPDIGALEFLTPMCSGTPTNSITGGNYLLCPGESAALGLATLIPDAGITYQWQVSTTSNVGPWTPVSGATGIYYTTPPITNTVYYSVVITCTAPGGGNSTQVVQLNVAGVTTSVVPYHENFEGIGMANRLPNCSWSASGMGMTQATYLNAASGNRLPYSGSAFATFNNVPAGTSYYYTNGIWMEPGITYSASLWYQTDLTGAGNWSNLSIMLGTAQSPAGLTNIATAAPAISPVYKSLSNTFTVPTAAFYYVAVKATGSSGAAAYLTWDDLDIMIPCNVAANSPTVNMTANNATVCSGASVALTASGADSYAWSTGQSGSIVNPVPFLNPSQYVVTGTKTLTGCSATSSVLVYVKASPKITISSFPSQACAGQPINLMATGALTYLWNNSATSAAITVTATSSNNSYTVIGTNSVNCPGTANIQLNVRNSPTVNVVGNLNICRGETTTLTASGAAVYNWVSISTFNQSNPVALAPTANTTYSLQGTDSFGCTSVSQIVVNVDECTGLNSNTLGSLSVYPNPTNGMVTVTSSAPIQNVQLIDVTGRIVLAQDGVNASATDLNISHLAAGVYYIQVNAAGTNVIKVIKD